MHIIATQSSATSTSTSSRAAADCPNYTSSDCSDNSIVLTTQHKTHVTATESSATSTSSKATLDCWKYYQRCSDKTGDTDTTNQSEEVMALKRRAASLETLLSNNMQNDNDILQQQFLKMKHQQFTSMISRAQNQSTAQIMAMQNTSSMHFDESVYEPSSVKSGS